MTTFKSILFFSIFIICISCKKESNTNITKRIKAFEKDTTSLNRTDNPKDSIDIIIEKRTKELFSQPIFASIKFGDNSDIVKKKIKQYNKTFNNSILIKNGDEVRKIRIGDISPQFYKGRLYELCIFSDDNDCTSSLANLYQSKYGATKSNKYSNSFKWKYSNVEIVIESKIRQEVPSNTYAHSTMYWASYGGSGGPGSPITKDPSYLKISYKNTAILFQMKKDQAYEDSLKQINLEKEKESDIAKSKEQATQI